MCKHYKYDVAFSVAGEDRGKAEQIKTSLTSKGISCFLYNEGGGWGKPLLEQLIKIYTKESKFVLLILSEHSQNNFWPEIEKQIIHALRPRGDDVLILWLDDTHAERDNISSFRVFEKWHNNPEEIAGKIAKGVLEWRRKRWEKCLFFIAALIVGISASIYIADYYKLHPRRPTTHVATKPLLSNNPLASPGTSNKTTGMFILKGSVMDRETKQPLDSATLRIAGQTIRTDKGIYSLSLPLSYFMGKRSDILLYGVTKDGYKPMDFNETIVLDSNVYEHPKNIYLEKSSH